MNNKISCSHLLSSLTVHCSYRLKFFVVRDHLWDGNSLPQLQSSWLRSTRGSRRSKYRGCGTAHRNAEINNCARRSRAIQYKMNDDVCGFHLLLYATLTIWTSAWRVPAVCEFLSDAPFFGLSLWTEFKLANCACASGWSCLMNLDLRSKFVRF